MGSQRSASRLEKSPQAIPNTKLKITLRLPGHQVFFVGTDGCGPVIRFAELQKPDDGTPI